MKRHLFYLPVLFLISVLFGCNANDAYKMSESFFELYNNKKFDEINPLLYTKSNDELIDLTKGIYADLGKINEFEKYSFTTKNIENTKFTSLNFKCKFEKSENEVFLKLTFVEIDNELFIKAIIYSDKQSFIDEYDSYIEKSELTVENYYRILKTDKFNDLRNLLFDPNIEQDFIDVILERREYYGITTSYELISTSAIILEDIPNVVQRYKCEASSNQPLYEEFWLKQKDDEFLIDDYYYAGSLETLY